MAADDVKLPHEVGATPQKRSHKDARKPEHHVDDPLLPPDQVRLSAWRWFRAAAILLTFFLGYECLSIIAGWFNVIGEALIIVVLAVILTLLLEPLVRLFDQRWGWRRGIATACVLFGFVILVALLIFMTYLPIHAEVMAVSHHVPTITAAVQKRFAEFQSTLKSHGIYVSLTSWIPGLESIFTRIVPNIVSGTVSVVVGLIIMLVSTFWFLKDGEELRSGLTGLFPQRVRSEVDFLCDAVTVVIGGYFRAQLLMALVIGGLAGIGSAIIGVPDPLVIGVATGVFELIPLVGPFVGMAVACLLALTVSTPLFFVTIVMFLCIHVLEGYVITPRLQGHFVRLHPVVIMLALVVGVQLGGFFGAMFALPVASLANVLLRVWLGGWKEQQPELFASKPDRIVERTRRKLLKEFHT